jgi:hypothetical protein
MGNQFGVKWSELLIPGLAGLAGSFNRDVGRGVGLGLSAYDIMKKHQVTPEQEEAKRKFSQLFGEGAERMRGEALESRRGRALEDETMVAKHGLQGSAAPTLPTTFSVQAGQIAERGPEEEQALVEPGKFGLGFDGQASTSERFQEAGLPGLGAGLQATPQGEEQWEEFAEGQDVRAATMPSSPEEARLEEQARAYDILQQLAIIKPETAGYMGAQLGFQGVKNMDTMHLIATQNKMHAQSRRERMENEKILLDIRHANEVSEISTRAKMSDRYTIVGGEDAPGVKVSYDKWTGDIKVLDLQELVPGDVTGYVLREMQSDPLKMLETYRKFVTTISDIGIDNPHMDTSKLEATARELEAALARMGLLTQSEIPEPGPQPIGSPGYRNLAQGLNLPVTE